MTNMLKVAPKFALPVEIATQKNAILAMTGAGKSNTAVVLAEELHRAGVPWAAIDPKGDWWGVRSSRDGTGVGGAGLSAHVRARHPEVAGKVPDPPRSNGHGPVELVWEDPPKRGGKPGVEAKYGLAIPQLRRESGRWARLEVFEKKTTANGQQNQCKKVEDWADIEFVARTTPDGGSALYARFKGEDDA